MSEYQYYEFQAVDRPLDEADRQALRGLSTRARITATSFTNSYEWGDLKGDPVEFMERWFDLHLYLANWGTRRLIIRLPKKLVNQRDLQPLLLGIYCATLEDADDNLLLDIVREEVDADEDWDDGSGWLAALAPLRGDLLAGDLRLLYLLWLMAVQDDTLEDHELEPMPGIAPMTGALEAFAEFFGVDPDLVEAAAERPAGRTVPSQDEAGNVIAAMADREKTELLTRLFGGDPHVAVELRALVRDRLGLQSASLPNGARTAGDIRSRAPYASLSIKRRRRRRRPIVVDRRRKTKESAFFGSIW